MKKTVLALFLSSTFAAVGAGAFEPIPYVDVKGLIGKQVWAASNVGIAPEVWVYAGEPLTVVSAEQYGDAAKGEQYNVIQVKNADGKPGQIQLRLLSKKALKYNLRNPGKAKDLIVNAFLDAYELPAAMHKLRSKYDYNLDMEMKQGEDKWVVNPDYHLADAMDESFKFSRELVHNLIYSTNASEEQVLRNDNTKWIALAKDEAILQWWCDGIEDKKVKQKFAAADAALSSLDNVSSHGFEISRVERERKERAWIKDMDGVPADKLKKLDEKNLAELNKRKAEREKKIKAAFDGAQKLKKQVT